MIRVLGTQNHEGVRAKRRRQPALWLSGNKMQDDNHPSDGSPPQGLAVNAAVVPVLPVNPLKRAQRAQTAQLGNDAVLGPDLESIDHDHFRAIARFLVELIANDDGQDHAAPR